MSIAAAAWMNARPHAKRKLGAPARDSVPVLRRDAGSQSGPRQPYPQEGESQPATARTSTATNAAEATLTARLG